MAKTITLNYNDETYTLEYTREAARMAEARGFILGELSEKPMTMVPILIQCAFLPNHRKLKSATIEKITASLSDKTDFIGALGEMYAESVETLFDTDGENEKNTEWKKSW